MPKTALYNMEGAAIGEVELSEEIFAAPINTAAMHLVVRSILANKRQGTQSALTRGEVRGGGRKIYRQKGTGNARHHGNRAPQFKHGGVVFAPKPRDYVINVPKKVRRLAFKSAMTSKLNAGEIIVVDELKLAEAKTKLMAKFLGNFETKNTTMLVLPGRDETILRAAGNIGNLLCQHSERVRHSEGRQDHPHQGRSQRRRGGICMKNPHDVILRPVLTEASYDGFADKRYVFEEHPTANKTEIKLALESIFKGIKVDKVNTLRTLGKMKRQGRTAGRTPEIKKAYVTLTKDSKTIEFFEGMAE